jgi:23S rRNA (adenine2503-C2)-methyltransferase
MKVLASAGREDIARVYVAELEEGKFIEFVEAVQPPKPRAEKWVLMISTLYGCPVGCAMCDAGGYYHGKVSKADLLAQIDHLVLQHFPDRVIPCQQFKIQFARMGEPAFNPAVLDVLEEMPRRYQAPGFMPSISTIAPHSTDAFFERLLEIKNRLYPNGNFQFQYSVHTTDEALRDEIIPVKKWSFVQMAAYGERFYAPGDRKITLNFALAEGQPLDPQVLLNHFDPQKFLIKITPLNPTYQAAEHGLTSYIDPHKQEQEYAVAEALREAGYRVILAIGEVEENYIGSNCGQYVRKHLEAIDRVIDGYTYRVETLVD